MKEHFCPAEQSTITYQGECSWCGEKEALSQTQEPDYWLGYGLQAHTEKPFENATPLYTTPPQRTWVGLTDEEMKELWENKGWYVTMYKAVEAKLKEKNT